MKYYLIYNPEHYRKRRHQPFEVYQLVGDRYELSGSEPFWIPEIGLGIGRAQGEATGIIREWLAWYDSAGHPYPLPEQMIRQERQRADQERQRSQQMQQALEQERQRSQQMQQALEQERLEKLRLLEQLRQLGLDREQP